MSGTTIMTKALSSPRAPVIAQPKRANAGAVTRCDARPLFGRRIVVTRPVRQAQTLVRAIQDAGGTAVLFPVLAIAALDDKRRLIEAASHLERFHLAVFVSVNAVEYALETIAALRPWPPALLAAVVGKSSEAALARFRIGRIITPRQRFDSEALLELPEFRDVNGKCVIIFRGNGGRELLGQVLTERGAMVEYVACYQRTRPELDPAPLHDLWQRHALDAVTVTSSEGLRNLMHMVSTSYIEELKATPVFVPYARIADQASALGFERVHLTAAGDEGLLAGLIEYFSGLFHGA